MPRSKWMRVLLIAGSALIIVGVALMWWFYATEGDRNVIKVELQQGQTQTVEFEHLGLIPGEKCEYTVKLKKASSDKYDLSLDFVEIEEKTLKNFVRVKILVGEETVCDELLATVFENEDIVLPVDFNANRNTELKIVYYLPIDVGNEAKNAEAIFELLLTASNE